MGQRQSAEQNQNQDNNSTNQDNDNNTSTRGRTIRPSARVPIARGNPLSRGSPSRRASATTPNAAYIPVNESQRREERRRRRARLRERAMNGESSQEDREITTVSEAIEDAMGIIRSSSQASDVSATTTTSISSMSPFSRMIVQVISEAVVSSFRNGQLDSDVSYERNSSSTNDSNRRVRQQLTMHLSPEVFQQIEPASTEDSFMRFLRLPVIVTSVPTATTTTTTTDNNSNTTNTSSQPTTTAASSSNSHNNNHPRSTAVNADGESPTISEEEGEITRILMLPVFLYGLRSTTALPTIISNNNNSTATNSSSPSPSRPTTTTTPPTTATPAPTPTGTRSSARIRERLERERIETSATTNNTTTPSIASTTTTPSNSNSGAGQWTVYIISGHSVENMVNDSPSYEDLLELAALIGPARRPTVSQEAIDNYVPIVKYTQQVKQMIVGNSDGCQVCLNSYQSEDDVRVLACHHGFHKDCIDKWLTEGQNQCPLCREVPIPPTTNEQI
ncbi:MAG: hypothetical protein EXX96DRAFT_566214 [Benjaminiella poitrasii]|nr:MAG: hypothetical protein EXX96DRAFT_566214 [Benjaminiella poitrasii]